MAFGLNVDFSGIIGNLTNNIRSIATSKISSLSNMVKSFSITNVTNGLVSQIQGMVGSSINLNLSKLTGGINFANALKGLPFPSLGDLNLNSLYGLIDQNIGANLNKFAQGLAGKFTTLNLDEISLGNKLTGAINGQIDNISSEIEAGIISGKSSLNVLGQLNNLSNTQIRDFTTNPQKQLDYVNNLVELQQNKIFDLSFNSIPESNIFENQINNLQLDSLDSFVSTSNIDFSFADSEIINKTTISKSTINKQQNQIFSITEISNPLTRKIDLTKRYQQEEKTLNYLKFLNDDLVTSESSSSGTVSYSDLEPIIDPDTNEIIGYNGEEITDDNLNDPSKRRKVQLDENGDFLNYI